MACSTDVLKGLALFWDIIYAVSRGIQEDTSKVHVPKCPEIEISFVCDFGGLISVTPKGTKT